jgi:hypothetical protein
VAEFAEGIGMLNRDKNEIFRAAHDASAATDFIFPLGRDRSLGEGELTTGLRQRQPWSK